MITPESMTSAHWDLYVRVNTPSRRLRYLILKYSNGQKFRRQRHLPALQPRLKFIDTNACYISLVAEGGGMEDAQARHRKEQRDLQSRVTQKKKQASKKTRKGVNDECEQLEAVLREKHAAEIAALDGEPDAATLTDVLSEPLEDLTLKPAQDDVSEPTPPPQAPNDGLPAPQTKKPNKAKARLAKRALEQEEQARQAAEEAKSLPDLKSQERARMLEYMNERGLREKEIRADGHCLYAAVADQLEQLEIPIGSAPGVEGVPAYRAVRAAAAEYIERHPDDFEAFLEEPLEGYLCKIRETGEWGGQLELMALAKAYGVEINVLQDFGRVEKIEAGAGETERAMWLGYYKHGFGLGEHYNSLRKAG
ncbi:OTU protein [Friedmanniomyces endolithicus]|nr:OTU protein [Friedmanniomyces endolithicus]